MKKLIIVVAAIGLLLAGCKPAPQGGGGTNVGGTNVGGGTNVPSAPGGGTSTNMGGMK